MDEWKNLEQALGQLVSTGSVEVHEDGEWLASLTGFRSEIRSQGKQTLIHLWSPETSFVRRILRVSACDANHIQVEVQRFGPGKPARLEFLGSPHPRTAVRIGREQFKARFARMLAEHFPDARVESLTTAADLKRSFSARYTRGVMSEGRSTWAVMAAAASENSVTFDGILSFGLLWLDWLRNHADRRAIEGLRLFLPEGQARATMERARALNPIVNLDVYEFGKHDLRIHRVEPSGRGNVESWLTPRRDAELVLAAADETIKRLRALLPQEAHAIEVSVPAGTRDVCFRFRGLEFARQSEGRMYCGLGDDRSLVRGADAPELAQFLGKLARSRSSTTSDANNSLYRMAPERWLETMVRLDPTKLDARLSPKYLYSQVPALAGGDRGIIDLLGVALDGRLVVIELKASEDLHLPLQAVDYWLRVRRHLLDGDFHRYGYFPGAEIRPDPPLIWLVAPGFRFHPANEIQLRYMSPEPRVTRIGLNENWRRGLSVVFRQ
ncbi:MAG TPA: hypothetical protein VKB26_13085 [Candidatus Acidoferrales bacterium]|nr:hypothetical protein [Candidatus Acidoferrales bacterium]